MRMPRMTYANVTATLALFIALGGTSWAVTQLPRNSVGAAQIRRDAVTSDKIRDGGVARADLAGDAVTAGPRGPRGAEGPPGPVGPTDIIQARRPDAVTIPSDGGGSATVATLTLEPGSWALEGQTVIHYSPGVASSEWYRCRLMTGTGKQLAIATNRIGSDAIGVIQAAIPIRVATSIDVTTQVAFTCSHPSNVPTPAAVAVDSVLQATRVGRIDERSP